MQYTSVWQEIFTSIFSQVYYNVVCYNFAFSRNISLVACLKSDPGIHGTANYTHFESYLHHYSFMMLHINMVVYDAYDFNDNMEIPFVESITLFNTCVIHMVTENDNIGLFLL